MPHKDPEVRRRYMRAYIARRIARLKAEFFEGKACQCGATEGLEIHHVDPSKKISHNVWTWGRAKREAELAKCVPRCWECHLAEHDRQPAQHGTLTMYGHHKCRCDACKAEWNAYHREYRNAQRQGSRV